MKASVIIPTCDKPEYLTLCLSGLARQTTPNHLFEIIIINDGVMSVDDSCYNARQLNPKLLIKIVTREGSGNVSASRNLGIKAAATNLCIFLDDDMIASKSLVESYIRGYENGFDVIKGSYFSRAFTINYQIDKFDQKELLQSGNSTLEEIVKGKDRNSQEVLISPNDIFF